MPQRVLNSLRDELLASASDGVVPRGTFTRLAEKYNTTKQNVGQTAKRMKIVVERGKK